MKPITQRAILPPQLDKAVERIMTDRKAPLPRVDSRITAILRVAADLRDLPRGDFKARLKAELLRGVRSASAPAASLRPKVNPIPEGYQTATTCLVVREAPRAIEFYKNAFGATELMREADPSGHIVHAEIRIGDTRIAIADETPDYNLSPQALGGSSTIIGLYVEDVDAFASRAIAAGAKVVFPISDWFYGDRGGRLADPFGHLWSVSTHIEDVQPEERNRRMEAYAREQAARAPQPEESRMTAVKPIPEGFHSITPYLQVEGAAKLIDFLKQAFGADEILRITGEDGKIAHAQVRIEGSMVEMADASAEYKPNPTAIWLFVDDADAVYQRALRAGAKSIHKPTDQDYGDREASVKDPFGNHWYIATHREDAEPLPEELRSVTPYLHPIGSAKVIDFLKQAFDAEELFRAQDPAGTVHHAKIRIGDSIVAMGEAHGPYQPMPPALHLYVSDADRVYQRALEAGATSLSEPADAPYGDRSAGVTDPFGNVWYIATHKKDVPVSELQTLGGELPQHLRPGSIMPFMYSEDPAGAFEFYQKVFGATELHRIVQSGGKVSHVGMAIGETHVMLRDATTKDLADYRKRGFASTPHKLGGTPLHLYIHVADADAAYQRALDSGAKVVDPMDDKEWGDRCGGVQDPYGHIWYIATPLKNASH
ncbi:MAG TPA: VOC family protein [Candidatus Binataceae bacterium]